MDRSVGVHCSCSHTAAAVGLQLQCIPRDLQVLLGVVQTPAQTPPLPVCHKADSRGAQKRRLKRAFPGPAGTMENTNFYYANPPRDHWISKKSPCGELANIVPLARGEPAPAFWWGLRRLHFVQKSDPSSSGAQPNGDPKFCTYMHSFCLPLS